MDEAEGVSVWRARSQASTRSRLPDRRCDILNIHRDGLRESDEFAERRPGPVTYADLGALPENVIGETLRRSTSPFDTNDPNQVSALRDRLLTPPSGKPSEDSFVADPLSGWIEATFGVTEGNPLWEELRGIALKAGPSFLFNVTLNARLPSGVALVSATNGMPARFAAPPPRSATKLRIVRTALAYFS